MATIIKEMDEIVRRWSEVTPLRSDQFRFGVENPKHDWRSNTELSNDNWKQAVGSIRVKQSFETGVKRSGTEKWQEKTLSLGVARWGPGVAKSKPQYETGFAPYRALLDGMVLPPRFETGNPNNFRRAEKVAKELHALKLARLGQQL